MTTVTHLLTDALRGFGLLFRDAGRVLAAHWPQLLGLFLAGWSWRMAVLWLVVEISDWSPTVAVLLLLDPWLATTARPLSRGWAVCTTTRPTS